MRSGNAALDSVSSSLDDNRKVRGSAQRIASIVYLAQTRSLSFFFVQRISIVNTHVEEHRFADDDRTDWRVTGRTGA